MFRDYLWHQIGKHRINWRIFFLQSSHQTA